MKAGWQTKRLGDVCEIIKGRKPVLKENSSDGDLPYLVARVMRGSEEAQFASVKDRNSVLVAESETIIICDGSNSGEVFTGFHGILSSTMGKLSKKAEIDDHYLRAFLASTFEVFNGAKTGAAIPHLNKEAMYQLEFPLPPLPEQRRIVGILDEAFDGIATAKANAEKNLKHARAIFESHVQSVFTKRGPGWVEKPLGRLASFRNGINYTKNSKGERVSIVGVKDFQRSFWVPVENLDIVTIDGNLSETDELRTGDILAVRSNGNVELIGRCILAREVPFKVSHSGFTIRIRLLGSDVLPAFLCHFMKSAGTRKRLIEGSTGTNIKSLNQGMLYALSVPLPSTTEQQRVVKTLDELSAETHRLATLYERKLAALEALKKSLLHQAFSGQLKG